MIGERKGGGWYMLFQGTGHPAVDCEPQEPVHWAAGALGGRCGAGLCGLGVGGVGRWGLGWKDCRNFQPWVGGAGGNPVPAALLGPLTYMIILHL